jgi:signal transduction histidine kinase
MVLVHPSLRVHPWRVPTPEQVVAPLFGTVNPWSLLRVRLTLAVVIAAVLPLLVWLPLDTARDTGVVVQDSLDAQRALAVSIAGLIDDDITQRQASLNILAQQLPALPDDATRLAYLNRVGAAHPEYLTGITVSRPDGQNVLRSDGRPLGNGHTPAFTRAVDTRAFVLALVNSPVLNVPAVAATQPILDADGQVTGVVSIGISPSSFMDVIDTAISGTSVRVSLEANGDTGAQVVGVAPPGSQVDVFDPGSFPGSARVQDENGDRLIGYAQVQHGGWDVYVAQDTAVATAPMNASRGQVLWLLMIAMLPAAASGILLAWRIAAPLRLVTQEVEAWRKGAAPTHLPRTGIRDVDTLVHALDETRAALEAREAELVHAHEQREQATTALRQRDEFLSIAAHELRTPVTVLKMGAQLLQRSQDDPERARHAMDGVVEGASRLDKLVANLLDVSRIQSGRLKLDVGQVDICMLVRAAAMPFPRVTFDLACDGETIQGDESRLYQVVVNLLSNADKYAPDGSPILARVEARDGGYLLSVTDHGIGLPLDERNKTFEPFTRLSNAIMSNYPGMGLGLHIARQIATLHGGRLWLESPGVGQGTTAFLWLPHDLTGGEQRGADAAADVRVGSGR